MQVRRDRALRVAGRYGGIVARTVAWHFLVPALRFRAKCRLGSLAANEVTVVTVNWNSRPYLEALLTAVRRYSPATTRITVVDNGSTDDSEALFGSEPDVRVIRLPLNLGHDLALDVGFLSARTEYVVALDVDAFPIHERWLDEVLAPLSQGCAIAGARLNREYVHPCCLAMRLDRFVARGHSFRGRYRSRIGDQDASGEVGEEMAARERGRLHFFEVTSKRGPGDVGSVFGGFVYHNFYSTRFGSDRAQVLDELVTRPEASAAWDEALHRYGLTSKSADA
jgi:glycosyltransferase involved in cell wall biosynthesis